MTNDLSNSLSAHLLSDLQTLIMRWRTEAVAEVMYFAEVLPRLEIVAPLARHLSWSHFPILIPLKSSEVRHFYAQPKNFIVPNPIRENSCPFVVPIK